MAAWPAFCSLGRSPEVHHQLYPVFTAVHPLLGTLHELAQGQVKACCGGAMLGCLAKVTTPQARLLSHHYVVTTATGASYAIDDIRVNRRQDFSPSD